MYRCQARPLAGVIETSQLVIPQRERAVASFDIGAGALEHVRELGGLCLEPVLLLLRQGMQDPLSMQEMLEHLHDFKEAIKFTPAYI